MSRRRERIGEQLRDELSRLLREEVKDPRIPLLSIVRVKAAPDLGSATVFWSPLVALEDAAVRDVQAGLGSAAGFLRGQLARRLSLRRTPELQFRHDRSIEKGSETLALIRELVPDAGEEPEAGEGGDDGSSA